MPITVFTAADTDLDISREAGKPPVLQAPPGREVAGWLGAHRPGIRAELLRSGSVLIRGLPVTDTTAFAQARDVLMPQRAGYKEKATPRTDFGEGVFSSTDLPAAQPIRLHNENSYTLDFPGTLLFGCMIAPDEGGATTVGDMRQALSLMPAAVRDRFAAAGWLLTRNFSAMAGLPWEKSFATDDPSVAEAYCRANTIGYEWLGQGALRTRQRRSAIITHPVTGEKSWFNHFAFWNRLTLDPDVREILEDTYGDDGLPFDTSPGDGTVLAPADVQAINEVYDQVTVRETWQPGDLLLVDNILNAHGREAFRGDRKIVVAMGEPTALCDCQPQTPPGITAYGR